MTREDEFIQIYTENIQREGADLLLEFLQSKPCDFFIAPASTKYHNSYEGGLVEHSLNVFYCLKSYIFGDHFKEIYNINYSLETISIVSLLHDICKINCYKKSTRNIKGENGLWQSAPYYEYDDKLPYGHGEKSVYQISGFIKLTREESFAIRYHMGFSGTEDKSIIGRAFEQFPLAFALSIADMEATYLLEKSNRQD